MYIGLKKTAITNHNPLSLATCPVDAKAVCLIDTQERIDGPRTDKDLDFVGKDRDRDHGHCIPLVQGIREFYKRHAISSSQGTRSTEGIFSGAMAQVLSSTSLPESPTAISVSFTTTTYLPAYLVTSSLKCSTIHRSSLSIMASHRVHKRRALETIRRGEWLRQSTVIVPAFFPCTPQHGMHAQGRQGRLRSARSGNTSCFETQHRLLLLKADLEARKDTVSPNQVKRYYQSLGKPNLGQEPLWTNLEFQVMQIHWDKTPIPGLENGNDRRQPSLDGLVLQDVRWHPTSSALQDRIAILYAWNADDQRQRLLKCLDREQRQHRHDRRQAGIADYPELSRVMW